MIVNELKKTVENPKFKIILLVAIVLFFINLFSLDFNSNYNKLYERYINKKDSLLSEILVNEIILEEQGQFLIDQVRYIEERPNELSLNLKNAKEKLNSGLFTSSKDIESVNCYCYYNSGPVFNRLSVEKGTTIFI